VTKPLKLLSRNRLAVVGIVVVLALAGFVSCNLRTQRHDPHLEAIRQAGYPATPAELDAWYPAVPDSENVALVFTNAFALLAPPNASSSTLLDDIPLPARGRGLPPDDRAELVSLQASNQAALEIVRTVKSFSRSDYPDDFKQKIDTLPPHLARVKSSVYLLAADAILDTTDGKDEEAIGSLLTAGRVANSLTAEPLVISQLVRMACWNVIISRLELVLNSATLTDDQLVLLQKMLAEAEQPQTLARAFAGERALGLGVFDAPGGFMTSPSSPKAGERMGARLGIGVFKITGLFQKDRSYFLDVMATNIAAAELPYSERFKASQQASALTMTRPIRFCIMSGMLLPAMAKVHGKDADQTAHVRVAQAALAVERHRRAHGGALPESLDQLSPNYLKLVPTDPIDGQRLRFKAVGSGYLIYGIGSDAKGDGGTELNPKNPSAAHDITFIVER